ncbi:YjgN family protein [Noviherbaspirillum sp.]|uniref:YjgN family protein n=1 Tax=Noviherbaspirillum sp. TaxID=1926288 RepID=UPI002D5CBBC4|nr:YjgN family protein [Noviherbaspirillum sp.]HZW22251.1 YjgN family protein [Noviherbaspirillum sp.]
MMNPDELLAATEFPAAPTLATQRFKFTGSGSEYLRIWIVNLFLTVVTLGIYSAWAKVRRTRYFYDNTVLAGSSFDYHGTPASILRGRIVALLFFGAYTIAGMVSEVAGGIALLVLGLLFPWLIWKSLQFKLGNSSYRGIRFGFGGTARKAYFVYLLLPILSGLTLYLLAPLTHQRIKKFQHEHSRFGGNAFSFHAGAGGFYKIYLIVFVLAFCGMFAIGMVFGAPLAAIARTRAASVNPATLGLIAIFVLTLYAWVFLLLPLLHTMVQNLVWNNTRLGKHRFASNIGMRRMAWITATNLLGIVLTLGLFIPFAQVRAMKYRIESLTLLPGGSLDDVIAAAHENASATGEGVADLLDFDLSL